MAKVDRERYDREKAAYKGPWKVANVKDPTAPKKPMSAFLAFGNERRRAIADANPNLNGTEISCLLSKLWRECDKDVKQAYRQREHRERQAFRKRRAEWERQKKRQGGESSCDTSSEATDEAQDVGSCMDASSAQASSQINDTEEVDESEWAFFGREYPDEELPPNIVPTPLNHTTLHAPCPRAVLHTPCTINVPPYQQKILQQTTRIVSDGMAAPKVFSTLSFDRNTKVKETEIHKSAKRFEDYSMDDILQDDELFEDFSPSQVKSYPIIKQNFRKC